MDVDTTPVKPSPVKSEEVRPDPSFPDRLLTHSLRSNRISILIVEENGEMRDHFKKFLGTEFDLVVAANAEDAVSAACLCPFDIVVQDIEHDKEFESVVLSKQLRQINSCKDAHFISITGYMLPEGKAALKRTTYDYHLAKPFTLNRLRNVLRLCVAKQTLSILNSIDIELEDSRSPETIVRSPECTAS